MENRYNFFLRTLVNGLVGWGGWYEKPFFVLPYLHEKIIFGLILPLLPLFTVWILVKKLFDNSLTQQAELVWKCKATQL